MIPRADVQTRLVLASVLILVLSACQTVQRDRSGPESQTPAHESGALDMPMDEITYSTDTYFGLVNKYTDEDGNVDYGAWKASTDDVAALDGQVELLSRVSPESHPDQFPGRTAQRSYWINTYNILVLHAVLEYWPLESVRDVKISFSSRVVPGKGFFYDRKVVVGGRETNLYKLEKEVLKQQKDPRLHFAFNCASSSCPVLRPWEWSDAQLDQAGRDFVNTPANVSVKDETVFLSSIFKWYRKDFPQDILEYLEQFAESGLQAQLRTASERGYRIRHVNYDWAVNNAGS